MSDKCPKCDYKKLKTWQELTADEKMTVKVRYSEFTLEERKRHRFCLRCGFEEIEREARA
jgi:Zn ribbon nucleic-acid-binding protein